MKQVQASKYFPRLLGGAEAAALTKLLFEKPVFFLKVNSARGVTRFEFRFSVSRELRQSVHPRGNVPNSRGSRYLLPRDTCKRPRECAPPAGIRPAIALFRNEDK
jgi:hypothetical protein